MSIRKGQHITVDQAIAIFQACPSAVLTRSQGGFFDAATRRHACDVMGISASQLTFRACEALAKRGIIKLDHTSISAGYWIADKVPAPRTVAPAFHPVAHLGEPKQTDGAPVEGLHVFMPDHEMYCEACGYGELQGDHGIIAIMPGSGRREYENAAAYQMYVDADASDQSQSEPEDADDVDQDDDAPALAFSLSFQLGNDALQTFQDIRDILNTVRLRVGALVNSASSAPSNGDGESIKDVNGNTVGRWSISARK